MSTAGSGADDVASGGTVGTGGGNVGAMDCDVASSGIVVTGGGTVRFGGGRVGDRTTIGVPVARTAGTSGSSAGVDVTACSVVVVNSRLLSAGTERPARSKSSCCLANAW